MTSRNSSPKPQARVWQRMLSGRRLDLIDPSPMDIEIEDIAHGLARVARWNGQTSGEYAFSVAQHSVIVEQICAQLSASLRPHARLTALLHDAPEYVIGDMISPFKTILGDSYKAVEARLEQAINLRFGLPALTPPALHKLIKRADHICAWFEAVQLAGFTKAEATRFFGRPPANISLELIAEPAPLAEATMIARFATLLDAADLEA